MVRVLIIDEETQRAGGRSLLEQPFGLSELAGAIAQSTATPASPETTS